MIWPHLEVIDFTFNKLNDFYEVVYILNGGIVRKEVIKVIAIKGNSFYNYYKTANCDYKCINNDLDG